MRTGRTYNPSERGRKGGTRYENRCIKKCRQQTIWSPHPPEKIHRRCRVAGWGDQVAAALESLGISKALIKKLTGRGCGCQKRQHALNRLQAWIGKWELKNYPRNTKRLYNAAEKKLRELAGLKHEA